MMGANVWFATGVTTGNDDNTITNCSIGAAAGGLPVRLIESKGSTTSAAVNNSGITIADCSLFDCFSATAISRMIDINAGSTDIAKQAISYSKQMCARKRPVLNIDSSASAIQPQEIISFVDGNTIGYSNAGTSGILAINGAVGTRLVLIYISSAATTASLVSK